MHHGDTEWQAYVHTGEALPDTAGSLAPCVHGKFVVSGALLKKVPPPSLVTVCGQQGDPKP